jgi:hypothetical protein
MIVSFHLNIKNLSYGSYASCKPGRRGPQTVGIVAVIDTLEVAGWLVTLPRGY